MRKLEQQLPALRRYARVLAGNRHDADDLVHDCIERALQNAGSLRNEEKLRQWLFSILHNRFLNLVRRAKLRGEQAQSDTEPEICVQPGQTNKVYLRQVLAAIDRLPNDKRAVLLLVAVEGFSYEATAQILDVPLGTVMSRLSRARADLREILKDKATNRLKVVK